MRCPVLFVADFGPEKTGGHQFRLPVEKPQDAEPLLDPLRQPIGNRRGGHPVAEIGDILLPVRRQPGIHQGPVEKKQKDAPFRFAKPVPGADLDEGQGHPRAD